MGSHLSDRGPVARCAGWILCGLGSLLVGCTSQPIPDYVLSDATKQLSPAHQEQIKAGLVKLFGEPTRPRLKQAGAAAPPEATAEGADKTLTDNVMGGVVLEDVVPPSSLVHGAIVYRARCAGCHGVSGDGNGEAAAYLQPKPRDYRRGVFKFTATPYGYKPARADLVRTIRRGAKGTSMPAFAWMSNEDMNDVIDYVISLSERGEVEMNMTSLVSTDYDEGEKIDDKDFLEALGAVQENWHNAEAAVVLPVTAEPAYNSESIVEGRKAFLTLGCSKCHGDDAKGQTEWLSHEFLSAQAALPEAQRIKINYDAWGAPAPAADLTARMLHGGRRPLDIYRRIYTGINGTPMPAFAEIKPETIWHLVHYVTSIVEGGDPSLNISPASVTPDAAAPTGSAASVEVPAPNSAS